MHQCSDPLDRQEILSHLLLDHDLLREDGEVRLGMLHAAHRQCRYGRYDRGNGRHGQYGLQFTLQKPGRCKVKHAIGSLWSPAVVPMTPQVIVPIVRTF